VLALVLDGDEGPTLPESWAVARGRRAARMKRLKYIVNPARGLGKKVMDIKNNKRMELKNVNWLQCRKECTWMNRSQRMIGGIGIDIGVSSRIPQCHQQLSRNRLRTETPHRPIRLTLI